VGEPLQVHLEGDVGEDADDQRHQQAQGPVLEELAHPARAQRVEGAGAGDDEDKGHHPVHQKRRPHLHAEVGLHVFDVPAPLVEKAPAVKDEDDQDGQRAQPVNIVSAGRNG
jgi:hypothetical protein